MRLPVHRWFRYSAGFSAEWVENVVRAETAQAVLDPFAGSGTTLLAAQSGGARSVGVEAHPFVARIAGAKLSCRTDIDAFLECARAAQGRARQVPGTVRDYPELIRKCFDDETLRALDSLRRAWFELADGSAQSELVWLALVSILRQVSHAGTAPWQYVLPRKRKRSAVRPFQAFDLMVEMMAADMRTVQTHPSGPPPQLLCADARTCDRVSDDSIDVVITSPPYPNNYDYADATRLEMSFMGEVADWADLHDAVRRHLITSCAQHWSERTLNLDSVLERPELRSIHGEIRPVCDELGIVRLERGGRKNYHLMVASYFADMARVWSALRRVCRSGSRICFVIGDSAPYGVYVPVIEWMSTLARAAGFRSATFERTRDRNTRWKNRKHRVPLCEGRLWIGG
jgi:DNA modification methylase